MVLVISLVGVVEVGVRKRGVKVLVESEAKREMGRIVGRVLRVVLRWRKMSCWTLIWI